MFRTFPSQYTNPVLLSICFIPTLRGLPYYLVLKSLTILLSDILKHMEAYYLFKVKIRSQLCSGIIYILKKKDDSGKIVIILAEKSNIFHDITA